MDKNDRNNTVLIVAIAAAGCLVLLCGGIIIAIFFFGISPFTVEEAPTETTTLSDAQLEQCRDILVIQEEVEIKRESTTSTNGWHHSHQNPGESFGKFMLSEEDVGETAVSFR